MLSSRYFAVCLLSASAFIVRRTANLVYYSSSSCLFTETLSTVWSRMDRIA
jgi:hypothetical protein